MKYSDRDKLVSSLREFADFIEEKGLELPITNTSMTLSTWLYDDTDYRTNTITTSAKSKMRRAALTLGKAEKKWSNDYFDLRKKFGCITLMFNVNREKICEKKVVGFKDIPEHVIAARREEIVEWECVDSILAGGE